MGEQRSEHVRWTAAAQEPRTPCPRSRRRRLRPDHLQAATTDDATEYCGLSRAVISVLRGKNGLAAGKRPAAAIHESAAGPELTGRRETTR
jgi:hypothetical protein